MAVSKRTRFEVLRRDNHTCRYCGGIAPDVKLTVDHVMPVALGGSDDPTNLVTACKDCNAGKTSTSPSETIVADVAADALRWARAMEAAADIAYRNPRVDWNGLFRYMAGIVYNRISELHDAVKADVEAPDVA